MPKKLLVVDDEDSILLAVTDYFTRRGYEVDCAVELEEAEALLAHKHFDIVIADLRLTGIHGTEGLEIISYVREIAQDTKVVLLTGYGSEEIERVAHERGVDAYLHKPIGLGMLRQKVEDLLASDTAASTGHADVQH